MTTLKKLFLANLLLLPVASQAALVTKTFEAIVQDGPLTGMVTTGSFSYDDSLLITGDEIIDVSMGLTVSFNFDGQTFDETNDVDYPDFPALVFNAYQPVEFAYLLVDGEGGVSFSDPALVGAMAGFEELLPSTNGYDYEAPLYVFSAYGGTEVPVPAAAWLFGSALLGLMIRKQR